MTESAISGTSQLTRQLNSAGMTESERPRQYLQPGLTARVTHPVRPAKPTGWVYERFDNEHHREIKFRAIDPKADLDLFHRWQNDPRVATFWEMAQPKAVLADYLNQQQDDRHTLGLVGYLDGEPFGYFEAYWCAEDRLGAYYDYGNYDRGWHGLTGSREHLGGSNTKTWVKGLCHYLFLDEPKTKRLMGEPRADNALLLRLTQYMPYQKLGEFDFPHKRSALMQLTRDNFFGQVTL